MLVDIPVPDLALFWKGRAQALRLLDKAARDGNEYARAAAEAYDECAKELEAALALDKRPRAARDDIEAQHGLNDTYPGDPYP